MEIIRGFLFGLGFFSALIFLLTILFMFLASRGKKVDVSLWKKYLKECMENEEYGEIKQVEDIIASARNGKTSVPKGYVVKKDVRIEEDGTIKLLKWIEKT